MTLFEEIQQKCTAEEIAERNFHVIAAIVNADRTRPNGREIGNGTILEVLGLTAGNSMLVAIASTPAYKYVVPLLDQGRLIVSSALVTSAVGALITDGVLTQVQGDALVAVGRDADPVTWQQVQNAFDYGV